MQEIKANRKFIYPFGCIVSHPSMSGKSHFIPKIIKNAKYLIEPPPDQIVYACNCWQKDFDKFPGVEFVSGIDGLSGVKFNPAPNNLLIIDDLMKELCNDKKASTLFTRDTHHNNVTVFFIVQNLFKQGSSMRDIALNSEVIVLLKRQETWKKFGCFGGRPV